MMQTRDAVRMLVFDPHDRLLLFQIRDHVARAVGEEPSPDGRLYWFTPGGGMEAGETEFQTLRREMLEETGLRDYRVGPQVAYLEHTLIMRDVPTRLRERFYAVHVPMGEIDWEGLTADEKSCLLTHRWWTQEELNATSEQVLSTEVVELARDYLSRGDTGVRTIIR